MSDNNYYHAIVWTLSILSLISVCCSLLTISLIHCIGMKENYYRTLLLVMTLCQLFYDASLALYICDDGPDEDNCVYVRLFGIVFFGLSSALWSNVLILIAVYVVFQRRNFTMGTYLPAYGFLILAVALTNAIVLAFVNGQKNQMYTVYNVIRLSSIAISFVSIVATKIQLHRLGVGNSTAAAALATRLVLYPLVQVVTRLGPMWYAAQYQTVLEDYGDVENPTTGRTVAAFASAILSPLAGIGNCFVFLYFQSDARIYIFSMLRSIFCADVKVPGKPLVKQTVATSIEPIYGHRLSSTAHVMFETMTGDELLTEIDTQFRNSLLVIHDSSVVMNTIHTK